MAREAHKKVEPALTLHTRRAENLLRGPEVASYESVADLLRRTREQYGEDLRSVAEALRIRYVHLLAIEEGRFRDLPGSTYALGFVRSYAEFLGLDGPEMVERFKEEVAELNRKTQLVFPTPVPEGKVPGGALILISVILLGAAYGAWTYLSRPGVTVADLIPPVPEHLQSLSGEDAAPVESPAPADPVAATQRSAAAERDQDPALAESELKTPPAAPPAALVASDEPTATEAAAARTSGAPAAAAPDETARPEATAPAIPAAEALAANGMNRGTEEQNTARGDQASSERMATVDRAANGSNPSAAGTFAEGAASAAAESAEQDTGEAGSADQAGETAPGPAAQASSGGDGTSLATVLNAARAPEATAPEASPLPEAPASDPEAAGQALAMAPADHLEGAAEEGIPEAPQLASRVPGREPQVYGADNVDARIVLRAHQDSWVQVRDAQDSLLLTRVLRQGDEYRVPNRVGLTLLTGNAGGIEILVDGRRLPPLGPLGSVRRDIVLDPDRLGRPGTTTR